MTAADEDGSRPRGTTTKPAVTLPVYYHWEFATGSGGDFETLARRLQAAAGRGRTSAAGGCASGKQPFGLPNGGVLQLEGALVAPGRVHAARADRPRSATGCASSLNLGAGEPVVAPPVYGRWQSARDDRPRRRRAAARGCATSTSTRPRAPSPASACVVVQEEQEQLVAAAWNQLGDPTAVRAVERRLEVAVAVLGSVVRRRLEPMEPGRLVQFLGPASTRAADLAARRCTPRSRSRACRPRSARPRSGGSSGRSRRRGSASRARRCPFQALATRLGTALPVLGVPAGATGARHRRR